MRLNSLTLAAFRSFNGITVPLGAPRVMIGGVNGAGKTSIRECVRWVLTGKAQGLDGRGTGVEALAPDTVNGATVQAGVAIEGIGLATRTWAPAIGVVLSVDRQVGSTSEQQTALYDRLKTTEAFLQAVIDSSTFLKLDHADAKALVMALLNVRVAVTLKAGGVPETLTLDELDAAYETAFNERKVAKKVAGSFFLTPAPVAQQHHPVEAIDATLKERREQLDALLVAHGGTIGKRAQLEAQIETLKGSTPVAFTDTEFGSVGQVRDAIAEVDERLGMMEQDAIGADIDEAMPTLPPRPVQNRDTFTDVQFFRSRVEALMGHQPKNGCVLDPEVPCETAKVRFTNRAKAVQKDIDAAAPVEAVNVPVAAPAPPAKANPLTEVRQRLDLLKNIETRFVASDANRAAHVDALAKATEALAALPAVDETNSQIADLRCGIQKGEAMRQAAVDYAAAVETHAAKVEEKAKLDREVTRLEMLVDDLGPKGVRVPALKAAISAFEEAINGYLTAFDYKVWFVLEPAWAVMVNGRRSDTYSESERHRIGIALQLAIAQMSGLNFAIVDELDMLTAENRETVAKMIHFSTLEQVIVLASREPEVALPAIDGVICHRMVMGDDKQSRVAETTGL